MMKQGSREGLGTWLWERPWHWNALDPIPTALRTHSFLQKPQQRGAAVSEELV